MLVLSRKSGEKIHVGEDVVIEIKRITGSRVTIAIDAPRDVRILRGELVNSPDSPAAEAEPTPSKPEPTPRGAESSSVVPSTPIPTAPANVPSIDAFLVEHRHNDTASH